MGIVVLGCVLVGLRARREVSKKGATPLFEVLTQSAASQKRSKRWWLLVHVVVVNTAFLLTIWQKVQQEAVAGFSASTEPYLSCSSARFGSIHP